MFPGKKLRKRVPIIIPIKYIEIPETTLTKSIVRLSSLASNFEASLPPIHHIVSIAANLLSQKKIAEKPRASKTLEKSEAISVAIHFLMKKRNNKHLVKHMKKAIKWLKENDDFAIIYDGDCDGICSASIITLLLQEMGKNVAKTVASPRPSMEGNPALELVKMYKNVILLDTSMDETNIQALKDKSVLNIDHHETGLKKSKGNIIVIKKIKPYSPTSLLAYELALKIKKDFTKNDWISVAGLIGDYGGPASKKFVLKTHKKYNLFAGEEPFFDSQLGMIAKIVNGMRMAGETNKLGIAVKALTESNGPNEFLKAQTPKVKYMHRTYEKVNKTLESELERFEKQATRKKNRVLFLMKNPKYNIRSTLVTIVSTRTDETIAVAEIRNTPFVHVSLRSQKENVLEIIDELKKRIECKGGGHKPAAGLTFKNEDFKIFKQVFFNE